MIYLNLLVIFLCIIFIHELGHYLFARIFKATVTDFSIGFGKVLYSFTDKNLTNWKISIIPLGGYVKIKGLESIFNNKKSDLSPNSFHNLNLYKKIIILLGGSFFNILSAWFILFIILFFFGIAKFEPIIGKIIPNSPADINNLKVGDKIYKINEYKIETFTDIGKAIANKNRIKIDFLRNNDLISKEFDLKYNVELNKFYIGITSNNSPIIERYHLFLSLKDSFFFIPTYYSEIFKYLTTSYKNNTLTNELAGPIGIVKMADQLMLDKIKGILFIFISISLFVGIFNLLPIPLLDGGHIVYFVVSKFFSDSLPSYVTKVYLVTGFTIISFIFLLVTFNDIFYK